MEKGIRLFILASDGTTVINIEELQIGDVVFTRDTLEDETVIDSDPFVVISFCYENENGIKTIDVSMNAE